MIPFLPFQFQLPTQIKLELHVIALSALFTQPQSTVQSRPSTPTTQNRTIQRPSSNSYRIQTTSPNHNPPARVPHPRLPFFHPKKLPSISFIRVPEKTKSQGQNRNFNVQPAQRKLELENESKQASLLSVLEEKLHTQVVGCLKILLHNFYCYIESSSNLQYGAVSFPYPSLRLLPNAFSSSSYSPLLRRRSSQSQALTFLVPKRAQIRGAKASQCRLKRQVVGKAVTVF
ncbi:hypothetical protein ACFX2I_002903 [Malus domestica]